MFGLGPLMVSLPSIIAEQEYAVIRMSLGP